MDVHDERIPDDLFGAFLQRLPQVSVELLLEHDGAVLLARRTNEPASGEWFVPGGRLYKGETFAAAVDRVAREELSLPVTVVERLGTYAHFWETGRLGTVDSTHTVNVVHHVRPAADLDDLALDDQHDDYRFVTGPSEELHPYVNQYLRDADLEA